MSRAIRSCFLLAAVVFGCVLPSAAFGPSRPGPKGMTQEEYLAALDMSISSLVLEAADQAGVEIPQVSRLIEIEDLCRDLPAIYAERLRLRDATGQPFLVITEPAVRLVGTGLDQQPDIDYAEPPLHALERAIFAHYRDDIVVAPAESVILTPGTVRSARVQATSAQLRSIGTALEAYSVDHNRYPGPTRGLISAETLTDQLSPTYIRWFPQRDGWGEPYLYWSDGQDYLLISTGADRRLDRGYEPLSARDGAAQNCAEATASDDDDLVFLDGAFCQSVDDLR